MWGSWLVKRWASDSVESLRAVDMYGDSVKSPYIGVNLHEQICDNITLLCDRYTHSMRLWV